MFPVLRTLSHSQVAYYNAGSAAIVLVLIIAALGTVFWCRLRKRRLQGLPTSRNEEEYIPLTHDMPNTSDLPDKSEFRARKGKERAQETDTPPLFDVGDSDEDGDGHT